MCYPVTVAGAASELRTVPRTDFPIVPVAGNPSRWRPYRRIDGEASAADGMPASPKGNKEAVGDVNLD